MSVPERQFVHLFEPAARHGALTLLLLHGTGGDERDLLGLGRALSGSAALLSPRGQVLERGMPRFFRRLAEGVFDEEDVVRRAGGLAAFVGDAADRYGFDPHRVVAVGFSNGANIAGALLLLHPGVLRGAALFAPMVPLGSGTIGGGDRGAWDGRLPDLSGVAAFLSAGRRDPIAPPESAERMAGLLHDAGAATELHWHDGGHALPPAHVGLARAWLAKLAAATGADADRPLP
jgi:predicted esterase